MELIMLCKVI